LELGGKSPLVVMNDADLQAALAGAIQGIFRYQGQICMGTSRIYVQRDRFNIFVEKFSAMANALPIGELRDPDTMIGPIISDRQRIRIRRHIEDARAKGATVVTGGDWEGNCCQPTVLTGVTKEMCVYGEETFGPVVSIYAIDTLNEALAQANDSEFGLSASIYTANIDDGMRFALEVESGMVHINGAAVHDEPHVPFGGTKKSGYGREGTEEDIETMTEWKWITIQVAKAAQ
jgi:acyl-CoA reductase-like NAD-dependent aldehyde dehydrogenase